MFVEPAAFIGRSATDGRHLIARLSMNKRAAPAMKSPSRGVGAKSGLWQIPAPMHYDLLYSLIISFAGSFLFLLVERYEPNRTIGGLLKFLVLFVSSVIILQRLRPYGLSLF
jgi:hypothetical protein